MISDKPRINLEYNKEKEKFFLSGVLDISTVPVIKNELIEIITKDKCTDIDFSKISRIDSVGLSLMIDLTRLAEQTNKEIKFLNIPEQMCAIARVSSLEMVLPISRDMY